MAFFCCFEDAQRRAALLRSLISAETVRREHKGLPRERMEAGHWQKQTRWNASSVLVLLSLSLSLLGV